MTVIPSFLPVKTRLSPKFHYKLDTYWHLQKISITNFELVDIYKRQVSTPSPVDIYKRQVSILVDIYKRRVSPILKLGGFSTSYVIATSELADSQDSSTIELNSVSIGYVIATSEPADS